jgi:exonuclease SbcC
MRYSLSIKNFRCHENLDLEFEEGTNLIKGDSGVGKTTIFEAIKFALYDIKKPFKFGKKECEVVLKIDDIIITRRKPKYLSIKIEDDLYENDQAQSIINNRFGEEKLFPYIEQFNIHKLISSTNIEKTEIIKKLAYGDETKIDQFKSNLKQNLKLVKSDEEKTKQEYEKLKFHFDQISKNVFEPKRNIDAINSEKTHFESLLQESNNTKDQIIKQQNELNLLNQRLNKLQSLNFDIKDDTYINNLKQEYDTLNKKIIESELRSSDYTSNKTDIELELNSLKEQYDDTSIQEINRIQRKIEGLEKLRLISTKTEKKDIIEKRLNNDKQQYSKYEELQKLKDDAISFNSLLDKEDKLIYTCPHCDNKVKLNNDSLVLIDNSTREKKKIIKTDYNKKMKDLLPSIQKDEQLLLIMQQYNLNINKNPSKLIQKLNNINKINQLESNLHNINQLQDKIFINKTEFDSITLRLQHIQTEIKNNQLNSDKFFSTQNEILDLQSLISQFSIPSLDDINSSISQYHSSINLLLSEIDQYNKWLNIQDIKSQLDLSKSQYDHAFKQYEIVKYISEISKTSEIEMLQHIIHLLNSEVNSYLKLLFNDEISLYIKTHKILKSGKPKTEIHIQLFYKNQLYDDVQQLSGGEKVRLSIAFTLAFNFILGNHLILLDESLNSIEEDIKDKIIHLLNQTRSTTLIISHESISGHFDHVISL